MTTERTSLPGRWLRPQALVMIITGLLLALGTGWGAASAAQATTTPAAGTATPAVTPAPNAPRLTIDIGQLNDSGVTGTATLYEIDTNETLVEISVKNVSGNHPSHIHAGTCDKIAAEPAYDLQNIDKNGKSTTLLKVALKDLLAKPYVIDAHLSPNELGTLIMCGAITGTVTTPTATAAATTPAATKATATTPAATSTATATAVATTPAATATATPPPPTATATTPPPTPTTAIKPTGAGGEITTPTPTTPAVAPAVTPTVASGKGLPAANGALGGDGTGGSTASSASLAVATTAATGGSASASSGTDGTGGASLASVASAGASGTATIFPTSDGTGAVIQVRLQGALVGPENLVHLHLGTCGNLDQSYTLDLNPVDGNGLSETTVGIPYQQLLTGGYAINVHQSADAYDTWLFCGDLTAAGGSTSSGQVTVTLLPQSTGAGTSIPRPETLQAAIAWALGSFALLVGACAYLIRRRESAGSTRTLSRWLRLGL